MTVVTSTPALPTIRRPGSRHDPAAEFAGAARDDPRIVLGVRRRIVVVAIGDAETAAEIDVVDGVAVGCAMSRTKSASSAKASSNGCMSVICEPICMSTPVDREAGQRAGAGVDGARARDRNAELVFRSSGGDLGVGARVDVRVDAKRDARDPPARSGDLGERLQLGLGFDVEAEDVLIERQRHFGAGLADPGKDDLVAGHAGGAGAAQLALG